MRILWDFDIQTDHYIEHGRPDVMVFENDSRSFSSLSFFIASPDDQRVAETEQEKIEHYSSLKRELMKIWKFSYAEIINRFFFIKKRVYCRKFWLAKRAHFQTRLRGPPGIFSMARWVSTSLIYNKEILMPSIAVGIVFEMNTTYLLVPHSLFYSRHQLL